MSLTTAQRAEQNRLNASRSTGPRSEGGKLRSRANALKHGLRAEVLPMPGEDPAFATGRVREWFDYYRPQSPAARHLTAACASATLFSDRVDAYITADAHRRSEQVGADGDADQGERVERHRQRLGTPENAEALAALRSFAAGRRWLVGEWERIGAGLAGSDDVEPTDVESGLALLAPARRRAFGELAFALDPHAPPSLRPCDPATARARLDALIAAELTALRGDESGLDPLDDAPASAADCALLLVPEDDATARLHLRYQAEARSGFLRLWKALEAVLLSDASERRQETGDRRQEEDGGGFPHEADSRGGCGLVRETTADANRGPQTDPGRVEQAKAAPPNEPERVQAAPPNEPGRVVEAAPKVTVVNAPAVRREPMVRDGGGRPPTIMNMYMVPGR